MNNKYPKVNVDILIIKEDKVLLGQLSKKWSDNQIYGLPGRDLLFKESIGGAVNRSVKQDLGCTVNSYEIICVNANYELNNHYIGIGVIAEINGNPELISSEDWSRWGWHNLDDLPDNLFEPAKNLIRCYNEKKFNISE